MLHMKDTFDGGGYWCGERKCSRAAKAGVVRQRQTKAGVGRGGVWWTICIRQGMKQYFHMILSVLYVTYIDGRSMKSIYILLLGLLCL